MWYHLLKIICFCCLVSSLGLPVIASEENSATDINNNKIKIVKLSSSSPFGEVSRWIREMDTIFPKDYEKYNTDIDLNNFESIYLSNLNRFLVQLSEKTELLKKIKHMTLRNGTSFRFNRIKESLNKLIKQNPSLEIEYIHSKIQSPQSPRKAFVAFTKQYNGYQLLNPEPKKFILCPSDKTQIAAKDAINNSDVIKIYEQEIQDYEKNEQIDFLQDEFMKVKNHEELTSWPPFEIKDKNQICEIYSDELKNFRPSVTTPLVFIILSGMSGYNISDLCKFCRANPSIKAIKFVDSALNPQNLEVLLPLIGVQLKMVDISGAFGGLETKEIMEQLANCLALKEKQDLINFFYLNSLSTSSSKNQKLMDLISDYIEIINNGDVN